MRTWIKLYTEIISDPKIGRLTDRQFRTCINLFALAGLEDDDGALPPLSDMAWQLRMTPEDLAGDLAALAKVNIVLQRGDRWLIVKWCERQAKPASADRAAVRERVQRHRAKQEATGNDPVTTLHADGNVAEEEEDVEVESEVEVEVEKTRTEAIPSFDPEFARAIHAFESDISLISGTIAPDLADMWDLLNANGVPDWWYAAIQIAVASNKRSWSYVRGILQNCLTTGRAPMPRQPPSNPKPATGKYKYVEQPDGNFKKVQVP